jgi:dTDP-4-dehydrorhamnose 3,5-epimerase
VKILPTPLKNAFVLEVESYVDHRGKFARVFCQEELTDIGHNKGIVQINHSLTRKRGAVRGLHFQYPPKAEIKVVKCFTGAAFDVIVDLRRNSSSFLEWHGEVLSCENRKMMYVPEGFAHGFQTLEDDTELLYLHTEFYSPEHEGGVRYDDPKINISWPLEITDISKKDELHPLLPEDFEGIDLR